LEQNPNQSAKKQAGALLPTEFSSLDLDERGFIYTTIASERRTDTIMRLNPAGVDILRRDGYFAPTGEIPPEVAEGAARSRSAGVVGRFWSILPPGVSPVTPCWIATTASCLPTMKTATCCMPSAHRAGS